MRTDFRKIVYVGLDVAEVMGIAIVPKLEDHISFVLSVKGNPVDQLNKLLQVILSTLDTDMEPIFVIEMLHHFRNKQTVRSLSERIGYLKHSLLAFGYQVREVGVSEARAAIGTKSKEETLMRFVPFYSGEELTSDHTDALAIALWAKKKDMPGVNLHNLHVQGVKVKENEYSLQ